MDKINKNSPQLNVSDNDFKIKLYPHQKALLHRILHINEKYKDTIYSYGCLTTIPSSGKTFMMLAYIGFDPTPGVVNEGNNILGLKLVYSFSTSIFFIATILVLYKYPLTQARHEELRKELEGKTSI